MYLGSPPSIDGRAMVLGGLSLEMVTRVRVEGALATTGSEPWNLTVVAGIPDVNDKHLGVPPVPPHSTGRQPRNLTVEWEPPGVNDKLHYPSRASQMISVGEMTQPGRGGVRRPLRGRHFVPKTRPFRSAVRLQFTGFPPPWGLSRRLGVSGLYVRCGTPRLGEGSGESKTSKTGLVQGGGPAVGVMQVPGGLVPSRLSTPKIPSPFWVEAGHGLCAVPPV